MPAFEGITYTLANNWFDIIPLNNYSDTPIKYLEIGTFYGANLLYVADSYCSHPNSKLYCIDPWEDYGEYTEYKGEQPKIYDTFIKNINNSKDKDKIVITRGYSNKELLKFEDDFFDIIYIDGNHEPEYVLEDAVLSFRKLKVGGIMIFDDYGPGGPQGPKLGIDAFLQAYVKRVQVIALRHSQLFVIKIV